MADSRTHPQGVIEIQQMFERSRLEKVFLALAYEMVVPIRRCRIQTGQPSEKMASSKDVMFLQRVVGAGA